MTGSRHDFRYNAAEGVWEGRCDSCSTAGQTTCWWELSLELWAPGYGLTRCRACFNLARRLRRRQTIAELRAKARARYRRERVHRLAWRKQYHAAHKEEINRIARERYAAKRTIVLWDAATMTIDEMSA